MNLDQRIITSKINADSAGKTLLNWLSGRFTYHPCQKWQEIINDGQIKLNDADCLPDDLLSAGDQVSYYPANLIEPPVDLTFEIIYEDDYLLVVNKSGDLPCHPAGPFFKHTLWHALSLRYGKIHIISRLDRETSGLLLVAKDPETAAKLGNKRRTITKEYRAMVFGCFDSHINASGYLIKDTNSIVRKKRKFVFDVSEDADSQKNQASNVSTILTPEIIGKEYSLVKAELKTGKLHQIRATLFSLGFPLLGDKLYGPDDTIYLKIRDNKITPQDKEKLVMQRQALHSCILTFKHPKTDKLMSFTSDLPEDFPVFLCR
ncbi:MAG: RluA family pseudouridine synthase [Lentisphaerae bacterium]|nr:RluA family pseudouridine synthase [Lentisphaerota bacterium]MCP4103712.1 RluA family pseudouridine synthase [Lentisphaerota bacterium]